MKVDQNFKIDEKVYAIVDYRGGDMFQEYEDDLGAAIRIAKKRWELLSVSEQKSALTFDVEQAVWDDDLECYVENGNVLYDCRTGKFGDCKFVIRDREAGNVIDEFSDYFKAEESLALYEWQDKKDGIYEKDFYEIVEAKEDPRKSYDKKNTKMISLKLNKKTDAKIIEWLESQDNVQGSIKKILEEYLDK